MNLLTMMKIDINNMNKEIYKLDIKGKLESFESTDEKLTIKIGEEIVEFSTDHAQDCCESVYGEFSNVKYYKEQVLNKEIKNIVIKSVSEMGFMVCFNEDYGVGIKIFIPCYNSQNGYYSSNLELVIKRGEVKTTIDISDAVEDNIN